ncbi:MAG: hypothetical protein AVDCRST_MAG59-2711, partial [uncultured Thermomicrobiales bacterium]
AGAAAATGFRAALGRRLRLGRRRLRPHRRPAAARLRADRLRHRRRRR